MSDKELVTLQEEHSELYVKAQELGVTVPDDLTVDFDTVETGRAVCASLEKLILANAPATEEEEDRVQKVEATPRKSKKTKSKPAAKKAAKPAKATKPAAKQESAMSTSTKKAKPAKKAKKAVAKKSNGENKTAKVVALMKRAKGVTREEVLKLTGWKAVSMQQLATNAGVKLKVLDESRPFHYKAA
jgi:hypothetical protein